MSNEYSLPLGWVKTTVSELTELITKGTTPTTLGFQYLNNKGILFVKVESIQDQKINHSKCAFINEEAHEALLRSQLKQGDVLISIAGTLGRVAIVRHDDLPANTNQALAIVRPIEVITSKFFAHSLSSVTTQKEVAKGRRGVGLQNLNLKQISQMSIFLPPLPEQKKIVLKLESLQAKSNKAKKALETAKPLLNKLRQSILAAAFRGDLTADWRKKNPDLEPASILLERIRKERRKRWEETELAKMKAKGKEPKTDKWKDRYKEPEPVDTTDLPELPDGWCWATLENLISQGPKNGYSPKASSDAQGSVVLKLSATTSGEMVISDKTTKNAIENIDKSADCWLEPGDLLIQRANSLQYIGTAAVYHGPSISFIYPDLMMRIRVYYPETRDYIWRFLNSTYSRKYFQKNATGTAGNMPKINGTTVRNIPVALPPLGEQTIINYKISKAFNFVHESLAAISKASNDLISLDQSILAKAFRGELVPQDPTDEPASVLLERIKEEREAMKTKKKTTKKRKETKTS